MYILPILKRWLRLEDELPPIEAAEAAARNAELSWLSPGCFDDFAAFQGAQGGFGDQAASLQRDHAEHI